MVRFYLLLPVISFSALFACSSGVESLREREGLRITDGDALSDDDSLVLPYQTTGSFLTMNCKWKQREGFESNKILCRTQDKDGNKVATSAELKAMFGERDVTAGKTELPASNYWNVEITVGEEYISNVDIALYNDGIQVQRQSVEMMLLSNQGIQSVRKINRWLDLNQSDLERVGVPSEIRTLVRFASPASSFFTDNVKPSPDGGVSIRLKEQNVYPETLCEFDGRNFMITPEVLEMNPWLKLDDTNKALYYWDPGNFYKAMLNDLRLPDFLRPFVEPIAEYVTDALCEYSASSEFGVSDNRCEIRREDYLPRPLVNSAGYCLKTLAYYEQNLTANKRYCDVGVFEKQGDDDYFYMMGMGTDRLKKINSDLGANSIEEAVAMYLNSFDKCEDFEIQKKR